MTLAMSALVRLAFLVVLVLAAAGPATAAPRGRVVVALASQRHLDAGPAHAHRAHGHIINQHVCDTLMGRDAKTWQPIPHLLGDGLRDILDPHRVLGAARTE